MRTSNHVAWGLTAAALVGAVVLGDSRPSGAAGAAPVTVSNTPLPVTAAQSGSWSVGLEGTPSVNIANTPTIALAPGASFRDADNPARTAIQFYQTVTFNEGSGDAFVNVDASAIPVGKRLVIEHISGFGLLPSGQKLTTASVTTKVNGDTFGRPHFFVPQMTGSYATNTGPRDSFVISADVRLYTDPKSPEGNGNTFFVQANRNLGAGTASFDFSLSGYIVDVP